MKTSRIALIITVFILASVSSGYAQKTYKWKKTKCKAVTITDAGDLYSTYDLSAEDKSTIKSNGKLSQDQMDELLANHREDQWSGAMATFDERIAHPEIIQSFKAFKVAEFDGKYVFIIPAKLNKDLSENFSPSKDIFLVMGQKSIQK